VEISVEQVIEKVNKSQGSAKDSLLLIMKTVIQGKLGRHYLTMRYLATTEPEIEKILRGLDKQRLSFVKSLFYELGFCNAELEARVMAFVYFMTGEHVFLKNKPIPLRKLKLLLNIFTAP
jgi:hypothetical protein